MVFKKVFSIVFLLLALFGVFSSICLVGALFSKQFRDVISENASKISLTKRFGQKGFPKIFASANSKDLKDGSKSMIFAKMGELLDSYDSFGGSPELNCQLTDLLKSLKKHYSELKTYNVSHKKLRSIAYQIDCLKAIIDVEENANLSSEQT